MRHANDSEIRHQLWQRFVCNHFSTGTAMIFRLPSSLNHSVFEMALELGHYSRTIAIICASSTPPRIPAALPLFITGLLRGFCDYQQSPNDL
jgi:hypothetical protein